MTWDEIRAAYPNQRIFVSAIEDGFDGTWVLHRPGTVLEPVPTDEHEAFIRQLDLELIHGTVVDADTSQPAFVVPPIVCTFHVPEDEHLVLAPMRVVVRHT